MRRNLTISFAEEFIARMDEDRGTLSRGRWLERGSPELGNALADGVAEGKRMVAKRESQHRYGGIGAKPPIQKRGKG